MAEVKFENIVKAFGPTVAVKNLNLAVHDKEFLVLVGPSGCGKTTTLRMLAGLEEPTQGKIYIDGKDITPLPPKDRDIAMVFQSYALYPHMNVYDNMAFGLRNRLIKPSVKLEKNIVTLIVWTAIIASIWAIAYVFGILFGSGFPSMILFGGISAFFLALSLYPDFRNALTWNTMKALATFDKNAREYIEAEKDIQKRVIWAANILEITSLLTRKPKQLSGGQRQRVALGRAIVREPKVFLMDEPLSNLDAKLRNSMRAELAELQNKLQITTVYVTHDQIEAMTLGHRIAVMNHGVIEQIGTPDEVYATPQTLFVAGFIGTPSMNFMKGTVTITKKEMTLKGDSITLQIPDQTIMKRLQDYHEKDIVLGIRPEHISITKPSETHIELKGEVTFAEPIGSVSHVFIEVTKDLTLTASIEGYHKYKMHEPITIYLPTSKMHFFDAQSEQRI